MITADGELVEDPAAAEGGPTVATLLVHLAERFARNDVFVDDDGRLTYAEADARSRVLAARLLAAGVGKGTRVGLLFPNNAEFLVTWLALARIGALSIPVNTFSTPAELRRLITFADMQVLIATERFLSHDYVAKLESALPLGTCGPDLFMAEAPHLRSIWMDAEPRPGWARPLDATPPVEAALVAAAEREVAAADPISVIFTSGSSGDPKGVVHAHGTLMRASAKLLAAWEYTSSDRVYTTMPFFWVGGLSFVLLTTMRAGAAILTSASADPATVLDFLERERATFVLTWPHTARALARHPSFPQRDLRSVRGGMLVEALPDARRPKDPTLLADGLGMTETAGPHTYGQTRPIPAQLRGSFGRPMPGMEHRIVDPVTGEVVAEGERGELLVRGDTMMLGIDKRERHEVFDADGWYRTGDQCSLRDGHLFFHGRIDDLIKTAGTNVSPREVEAALARLRGVSVALVVGIADPDRGQAVAAAVVAEQGVELEGAEIRADLAAQLSSYKVPRLVRIMAPDEIPMLTSGKVDRRRLATLLSVVTEPLEPTP